MHCNVYHVYSVFYFLRISMFILFINLSISFTLQCLSCSSVFLFFTRFNVYHIHLSISNAFQCILFFIFPCFSHCTSFLFQCLSLLFIRWLSHFHVYHFHWSFDFLPISMPLTCFFFYFLRISKFIISYIFHSFYFLHISRFLIFIDVSISYAFPCLSCPLIFVFLTHSNVYHVHSCFIPYSFPERQHFGRTYIVDVVRTSEESAMDVLPIFKCSFNQSFVAELVGIRWGWANA